MSHFIYTIGLKTGLGGELYQFDGERSKLGGPDLPIAQLVLTRPLIPNNPLMFVKPETKFPKFIIRKYDKFNNLMHVFEYHNINILKLEEGPDLILEFGYKP